MAPNPNFMSDEFLLRFNDFGDMAFFTEEVQGCKFRVYEDFRGYYRCAETNELVHRLVAQEFCHPTWNHSGNFDLYEVHHIDKNKTNNNPSNLEVLTSEEHHAKHGVRDFHREIKEDSSCDYRADF